MKKFYFIVMLCVAAMFSANAQSAEAVSVKDLNYRFISKLPFTIEDALTSDDPVLSDYRKGYSAKGYAFSLTAKMDVTLRLTKKNSSPVGLSLLDANYEEIAFNDYSDSGSCVVARLDPGTYYIVATILASSNSYTLTVKQETNAKLVKELTYKPVTNFTDTLKDSLTVKEPYLLDTRVGCRAKGYSVQLAAGDVFSVYVAESEEDMYLFLFDKNFNLVASNDDSFMAGEGDARVIYEATTAGTYNLVVTTYKVDVELSRYSLWMEKNKLSTYYIDPVNGDDAGTGITPSRPLKTLDAAVDKSGGMGIYYLMNDYQFGMTGYEIVVAHAKLYPYQKNIRLSNAEGYDNYFVYATYDVTIGNAQGEYYFTVDSITMPSEYLFYVEGGSIELNKFKMSNSEGYGVLNANTIGVTDCEIKNCTFKDDIFYINNNVRNGSSYLKNVTVKDCQMDCVLDIGGYSSTHEFTVDIENGQFTSNTFDYLPIYAYSGVRLNLKSGAWQYNTRTEVPSGYSFSPKLNKASLAGIDARYNAIVTLYSGFTWDVNNFIMVDPTSFVNLAENLSGDKVATILPIVYEIGNTELGYEEGRQVLTGSRSLLNANYQKFALAQVADDIWYLRADGKVYLTPVGIKEDVLANTVIYPNPVTDQMTVRISNVDVTDLTVIDAYGRLVMTSKVNGNTEILNLSNLSSGMYFVQFRDHNTILGTQKIIKK